MVKGRDIIIFGDDWGRFPSTIQHIGMVLAKSNRILWIGSLGLRKPTFSYKDFLRMKEKCLGVFLNQKHIDSENPTSVTELHPFVLPFHDFNAVRNFNDYSLKKKITREIDILGFKRPILITSSPVVAGLVGRLGETSSHYVCLDDYSSFAGAFNCLSEMESLLLKKVNSCFAVSQMLQQTRKPEHGESYFLPQGVDIRHFSDSMTQSRPLYDNIKRPVIGFFGLLAPWINIELIVKCAKIYRNATFLIIGKAATDISIFSEISNILYIGEIPYEELPAYAQCFDVGLIPFDINKLTLASNPLKLLEYMAMGLPIVSTDLPEVGKFSDFIFVAKNDDEFISFIAKALEDNNTASNAMRKKIASEFSWQSVTERISEVVLSVEQRAL